MKKIIAVLLCTAVLLAAFCSCSSPIGGSGKLKIVTTIFPVYDWVNEILGEKAADADIVMLLDTGVDLHSFQPTADDIVEMASCDLFVYVGGESDSWVADTLENSISGNIESLNLLGALGDLAKNEETVEGMQNLEESEEEEEPETDEHIWLSLKNASVACNAIAQKLCEIDPDNSDIYNANLEAYTSKLNDLDAKYEKLTKDSSVNTLIFCDRFPFRYLADDYNLEYYAAFSGCSAESEASFETVTFLSDKLKETGISHVIVLEGSDNSLAQTVISGSGVEGVEIVTLNSMQSVTAQDVQSGADYYSIMTENFNALSVALGGE